MKASHTQRADGAAPPPPFTRLLLSVFTCKRKVTARPLKSMRQQLTNMSGACGHQARVTADTDGIAGHLFRYPGLVRHMSGTQLGPIFLARISIQLPDLTTHMSDNCRAPKFVSGKSDIRKIEGRM